MATHSKVRSFILSNLVNKDNRMVGVEEECILHNEIGRRIPINSGNEFSAENLLNIMNENADGNGIYSLEPGGQLEWSSPPFATLNELEKLTSQSNLRNYSLRLLRIKIHLFHYVFARI